MALLFIYCQNTNTLQTQSFTVYLCKTLFRININKSKNIIKLVIVNIIVRFAETI